MTTLRARRALSVLAAAASLQWAACGDAPSNPRPSLRLSPSAATDARFAQLADRDTTSRLDLDRPLDARVTFDHPVELRAIKLHGAAAMDVLVDGERLAAEDVEGWQTLELDGARRGSAFRIELRARAAGARLGELELWGAGRDAPWRSPEQLAEASRVAKTSPFENAAFSRAQQAAIELTPGDESCAQVAVKSPGLWVRGARRAFLAYEAAGVQRSVVLRRSLNGRAAVGGFWLGGGKAQRTVVDELNPNELTGDDALLLCLPAEATAGVRVETPRLVLALEDGVNPLDRDTQARLAAALDDDAETAVRMGQGAHAIVLDRPTSLAEASLAVAAGQAQARARLLADGSWRDAGELAIATGRAQLPLDVARVAALELTLPAAARAGLPVAELSELRLVGSGEGPRVGAARIILTSPVLRADAAGDVGEHFAGRAYVAGWAESPAGLGVVEVDGAPVGAGDGSFGTALTRRAGATGPWTTTVTARFPDGTVVQRVVRLDDDHADELRDDGAIADGLPGGDVERFGAENQTAWGPVDPGKGGRIKLGSDVELEASEGAVDRVTPVGITRKGPEVMPPLDPGMVNVTSPRNGAYRFSPPGQKFKKAVKVKLPYDEALLPEGMAADAIQTFFFDPVADRWVPLKRVGVEHARKRVVSETDHFTFMINAVLVVPEHPGTVSFNPNSIKDLKVADPAAGIDLIEAPEGNSQGTARLQYPLRLPKARGSYQPSLSLNYDSGAGSGWVGVGWELGVSTVSVDTRFGVPTYTGEDLYLLDGQMLLPAGAQGGETCIGGATGRRYKERIARGFQRIRRCGSDPSDFYWEVTDTSGTVFVYGHAPEARLADPEPRAPGKGGNIAEWMLERVVDSDNNATLFTYARDHRAAPPSTTGFVQRNPQDWRRLYLASIRYSARVTGPLDDAPDGGAYEVTVLRKGQAAPADPATEREDITTGARTGFKVATRFLLGAVRVSLLNGERRGVIREYRLDYFQENLRKTATGTEDYGRSLLKSVTLYGAGPERGTTAGPAFYAHEFDYHRSTASDRAFASPQVWALGSGGNDGLAFSDTVERSTRNGTYVGLAPPAVPLKSLSSGRSWGSTAGERRTLAQLVDVNGDGLPDRVEGARVRFNHATPVRQEDGSWVRQFLFSAEAPAGDPAAGGSVSLNGGRAFDLARERIDGDDAAWETHLLVAQGSLGDSSTRSDALRLLMDANGDGIIDVVSGNGVRFGRPRSLACQPGSASCCPAGDICFDRTATRLEALSLSADALAKSPKLLAMLLRRELEEYPTDALVRWVAPYTGKVDVAGRIQKLREDPTLGDGVKLEIFGYMSGLPAVPLKSIAISALDTSAKDFDLPAIDVASGDALFFKVTTLDKVPLGLDGTRNVGLDEVALTPTFTYSHFCAIRGGDCSPVPEAVAAAQDPSGHPLTRYSLEHDLRVAGAPWMGMQATATADVTLGGTLVKRPTADDVTVCIQKFPAGQPLGNKPCSQNDLAHARLDWNASETRTVTAPARLNVGETVVFRIESDSPVDPAAVSWHPRATYHALCAADGTACTTPSSEDRELLERPVEPLFDVHTPLFDGPPQVLVASATGKLTFVSSVAGGLDPRMAGVTVVVHRGRDRVFKAKGNHSGRFEVEVSAGDALLVRAYSREGVAFDWTFRQVTGSDPASGEEQFADVPRNRAIQMPQIPFSGGYRNFSVGQWNGDEAFDPRRIVPYGSEEWEGKSSEEIARLIKKKVGEASSPESQALRLFAPLLPRQDGTDLSPGPVWASIEGATFVGPGRLHGARRQAQIAPLPGAVDDFDADVGVVRTSLDESNGLALGGGYGGFGLSVSGSSGTTTTLMDTLDFNGDGLVDTMANGEIRLSRPGGGAESVTYGFPEGESDPRLSRGFSLMFSPSMSIPSGKGESEGGEAGAKEVTPGDVIMAVAGVLLPSPAVSMNRDETEADLVDVNGDGLPDRVSRKNHAGKIQVWLNLGNRFASQADELPIEAWTTPLDSFMTGPARTFGAAVKEVGKQLGLDVDTRVRENSALRHTTAMTVMGSWGLSTGDSTGVAGTAAFQSSVTRTSVDIVDVSGDGLPDLVKKGANDQDLLVQLNLGYGFAPQETWRMPSWGSGVKLPALYFGTPIAGRWGELPKEVLDLGLGVNADGEVDGLNVSSSYSDPRTWGVTGRVGVDLSWLCIFCPSVIVEKSYSETQSRSRLEMGLQDLDGDGFPDHVLKRSDSPDVLARMNRLGEARSGLLKKVHRPLGASIELDYVRQGNTVDMPQSRWVLSEVVVRDSAPARNSRVLRTGQDFRTSFRYEGGYYHRTERAFFGFESVIRQVGDGRVGGDGRRVTQVYSNRDYALSGVVLSETLTDHEGRIFTRTTNTYNAVPVGVAPDPCRTSLPHPLSSSPTAACQLWFPQLKKVTRESCEGTSTCKSTAQTYEYDLATGNVTDFTDLGDEGTDDDLFAHIEYPPAQDALAARHVVSVPIAVTVRDANQALLRQREAQYSATGNLEKVVTHTGGGRRAEVLLAWTPTGNLERVEGPLDANDERHVVRYTYEKDADTYIETTTETAGVSATESAELSSQQETDLRFGEPVRTVDVNANVTTQRFDVFGRLTHVFGPYEAGGDEATLELEYDIGTYPARAVTRHRRPAGEAKATLDTAVFVDGLKRTLQTKKDIETVDGVGFSVSGRAKFDLAGRVAELGQTTFAQGAIRDFATGPLVNPTRTQYDVLDRTILVEAPDKDAITSTTTTTYGFGTPAGEGVVRLAASVADGNGNVRVVYRDLGDRIVAVEELIRDVAGERRPTTRYGYDPLGQLVSVRDAAGNVSSFEYDFAGRRTVLSTPDGGKREVVFDAAGNAVERWDGNLRAAGEPIRYRFRFNRLVTVDYPRSRDVQYVYGRGGSTANDAGRVQQVTDEVGSEVRRYGKLGELVETVRTVRPLRPGDRPLTFTTKLASDSFGRMLSVTYPDGEQVRYGYDAGGLLRAVAGTRPATGKDPAETEQYVKEMRYDVHGRRVRVVLGNGVTSTYGYEPRSQRLETLRTTSPAGLVLQELTYAYDKVGNVKAVSNALGPATPQRAGGVSYTFDYDTLNRMTSARGSLLSRPGVEDAFSVSLAYSDIHNLVLKHQTREVIRDAAGGRAQEKPARDNYVDVYSYAGEGPHQVTRIGDTTFAYDANGNTLAECRSPDGMPCDVDGPGGAGEVRTHLRRYVWSEDDRLSAAIDRGGRSTTRFLYDAAGERVAKLGTGGESLTIGQFFSLKGRRYATKHVFAGEERVASKLSGVPTRFAQGPGHVGEPPGLEGNVNGCEPSDYQPQKCPVPVVEGPDPVEVSGQVRPATYYFHPDHLGSASWLTDANGAVYERVEYYPFGDVWTEERGDAHAPEGTRPDFGFTGKPFDEETGLTYFGARYYDARKARWLSTDPALGSYLPGAGRSGDALRKLPAGGGIFEPHNLSPYAYAHANPVTFKDPDGNFVIRLPWTNIFFFFEFRRSGSGFPVSIGFTSSSALEKRHPKLAEANGRLRQKLEPVFVKLEAQGYKPMVWELARTLEQQRKKVEAGVSDTMNSRHLDKGAGHTAADVVDSRWTYDHIKYKEAQQFFLSYGEAANEVGLEWGGDWENRDKRVPYGWDPAHTQLPATEIKAEIKAAKERAAAVAAASKKKAK